MTTLNTDKVAQKFSTQKDLNTNNDSKGHAQIQRAQKLHTGGSKDPISKPKNGPRFLNLKNFFQIFGAKKPKAQQEKNTNFPPTSNTTNKKTTNQHDLLTPIRGLSVPSYHLPQSCLSLLREKSIVSPHDEHQINNNNLYGLMDTSNAIITPRPQLEEIKESISNSNDNEPDGEKDVNLTPKNTTPKLFRTMTEMKKDGDDIKTDSNQKKFEKWLKFEVKLGQYLEAFKNKQADDITVVQDFDKNLLLNEIKVTPVHVKKIIRNAQQYKSQVKEFDEIINEKDLTRYRKVFNYYNIYTLHDLRNIILKYGNSKIIKTNISKQHLDIIYKILGLETPTEPNCEQQVINEDVEGH